MSRELRHDLANARQALDLIRGMLSMATLDEEMRAWMLQQQVELEERVRVGTEKLEASRLAEERR